MVTFLKLAGLTAFAGFAFAWWLQAPVLSTLGMPVWIGIGVSLAFLLGAFGAAQTRAWVGVPVAVIAGLVLGAAWVEWRLPSDVPVSVRDHVVSAVSTQGRFIALGAVAAAAGVLLVRLLWMLLFRWAMKQARSRA